MNTIWWSTSELRLTHCLCHSRHLVASHQSTFVLPWTGVSGRERLWHVENINWEGARCKVQGARSKEQGARSKEQGARSKEQGARRSSELTLIPPVSSLVSPARQTDCSCWHTWAWSHWWHRHKHDTLGHEVTGDTKTNTTIYCS